MKELTKKNYVAPVVNITTIQLEEGICNPSPSDLTGKDSHPDNGASTEGQEEQNGNFIQWGNN